MSNGFLNKVSSAEFTAHFDFVYYLFLAEPVFRQAIHHAVLEAEAEVVHRLAQHGWRGPLGIEIGIAAGEG